MAENYDQKKAESDNPPAYSEGNPTHMPGQPQPLYPSVGGHFGDTGPPTNAGQPPSTDGKGYPQTPSPAQPGGAVQTTVIISQPHFNLRESPVNLECPHCHQNITTQTNMEVGLMAWLICLGIMASAILVGVTLLCCWIPFCIPAVNDVNHSCPNCGKFIGKFKRMGA